jgi:ribonuclease VapC
MVIDTSALLAIFLGEADRDRFMEIILHAGKPLLSTVTLVESANVLESRRGKGAVLELDLFLPEAKIEIVSVDANQAREARSGFSKYGKGRHSAALNFGECFTYALAVVSGEAVLAKGEEFRRAGLTTL